MNHILYYRKIGHKNYVLIFFLCKLLRLSCVGISPNELNYGRNYGTNYKREYFWRLRPAINLFVYSVIFFFKIQFCVIKSNNIISALLDRGWIRRLTRVVPFWNSWDNFIGYLISSTYFIFKYIFFIRIFLQYARFILSLLVQKYIQ